MTPQTTLRTGMPTTLLPMPQSGYCRWGSCCHLQNPNPCAPFPSGSVIKNPPANAGDAGEAGKIPGGRNGNLLHYSCLENPTDRGAWWDTVCRIADLDTPEQLSTHALAIFTPVSQSFLSPASPPYDSAFIHRLTWAFWGVEVLMGRSFSF